MDAIDIDSMLIALSVECMEGASQAAIAADTANAAITAAYNTVGILEGNLRVISNPPFPRKHCVPAAA